MEFSEKLLQLRKNKKITQEELAETIYVSRTAISKWESGRGYPNIDSLKALAKFFSVTVDELISSEEMLTVAEEDNKRKEKRFRDIVYGLLDISIAMLFFLPLFGMKTSNTVLSVSLIALEGIQSYLKTAYFIIIIVMILNGVLTLALQNCQSVIWANSKTLISLSIGTIAVLTFTISLQPYVAIFTFCLLIIKIATLIKW